MKNLIKSGVIWVTFGVAPLSSSANNFWNKWLKKEVNTELFINLDKDNSSDACLTNNKERINSMRIEPKIVTNAILNYFDQEVKMYKLSPSAKSQIVPILNTYFSEHSVFVFDPEWKVKFVIDDKKEFSLMVKKVMSIVIDDMPFFVRKVVIPLFLWWNDAIQQKLDNLDATMMNMKEKQYRDMILDYVAWITKRIMESVDREFTVWEYYHDISSYYPNKNWNHILQELNNSGQAKLDIRNYTYKK